ncbi:MAG: S-layer protein [Methanomicrobiales archaeon]|nr:S-layer protein [Methanomicrobiales archaeon]
MRPDRVRRGRSTVFLVYLAFALVLAGYCVTPASAGERYMSGDPNLTASVLGANEFHPGAEVNLPVIIQNSGLIEYMFTYPTTLTPADLPNTAKLMLVDLRAGDAPVTVVSDPQMVGDLKGGDHLDVIFKIRVNSDAPSGTYRLPLFISYTYLDHADQYGQDLIQYYYSSKEVDLELPLVIKPEMMLEVVSSESEDVLVGLEGFSTIILKNTGNEDGSESVVNMATVANSPVQPVASSVYIGDFRKGSEVTVKYKIRVSKDAEPLTYPINVSVTYRNRDGAFVTTDPVIIGVQVQGKISFNVLSPPPEMTPGSQGDVEVTFSNTGSARVYGAQAQIYTQDPFTTGDDYSYLGDMAPGERKTAVFRLTVDKDATVKDYALDSEIKYRDFLDNDEVSDRIRVQVKVVPLAGAMAILTSPYTLVVIILAIIGGVFAFRSLKSRRSR